jgi:hypothetical protein
MRRKENQVCDDQGMDRTIMKFNVLAPLELLKKQSNQKNLCSIALGVGNG